MKNTKTVIGTHLILAGTPAGSFEKQMSLGQESNKVLGYYALAVKNGGIIPEQCLVNFANSNRNIFEPIGLGHLLVNQSVAIKDRFFMEDPFDVAGNVNVKMTTPAVTTSDLLIQYVFFVEIGK